MKRMNQSSLLLIGVMMMSSISDLEEMAGGAGSAGSTVDDALTVLEKTITECSDRRERLDAKLKTQVEKFKAGENALVKAEMMAEIIDLMSRLNANDRKQVAATFETISSLVRAMGKLKDNSPEKLDPDKLQIRRRRIRNAIQGVFPIAIALSVMDDRQEQMSIKTFLSTILLLCEKLSLPVDRSLGLAEELEDTVAVLEDTACDVRMLQELLEVERIKLTIDVNNQLAGMLGLLSLARSKLSEGGVQDCEKYEAIALKMHKAVLKRLSDAEPMKKYDLLDEEIWNRIMNRVEAE